MDKPVQWMTLQELRHELHRTSQAWETLDLDGVLADGELAAKGSAMKPRLWCLQAPRTFEPPGPD
jgi:hypothetical protein